MNVVALIEKEGWLAADLVRAALDLGLGLSVVCWTDLAASLGPSGETVTAGGVVISDADVVLLRTMRVPTFEQVFFRMDALHRLEAMGTTVVNTPSCVEICVDKYRALAMVRAAAVATPETFVCQCYDASLHAFESLGGDVVVKPMFGSQGFGVVRITDRVMAQRAFAQLERMGQIAYVQQYVGEGEELRLLILGDALVAAVRKSPDAWPRNAARGTRMIAAEVDAEVVAAARTAARACGAEIAGVDVVVTAKGSPCVLEVNAMPGWRTLAKACDMDVTRRVLAHVGRVKAGCRVER